MEIPVDMGHSGLDTRSGKRTPGTPVLRHAILNHLLLVFQVGKVLGVSFIERLAGLFEHLPKVARQLALLSCFGGRRIVWRALKQGTKARYSVVFSHFWE
jgi:hypothetical protein